MHNQHQGLIGFNEKVTRIWISDTWSDLETDVYLPYVYAAWRVSDLDAESDFFFEGTPEWIVDATVDQQWVDSPFAVRVQARRLEFEGDGGSGWVNIAAIPAADCSRLNHVDIEFEVQADNPGPNPQLGNAGRRMKLNCDAIAAQAALPFYGGPVHAGVVPTVSGTLFGCSEEIDQTLLQDNITFCLDGLGRLRGHVPGGVSVVGEPLGFFADMSWIAHASLVAR
jgi:hypothetical protein